MGWWKQLDEGTKKGIYFAIGVLLSVVSVLNYKDYQVLALIGILVGIFFIVKALS